MVFHDVSTEITTNKSEKFSSGGSQNSGQGGGFRRFLNIAPLNDRLLALFFDFLIFSPLVSLWVAGIRRQINLSTLLEADDSILGGFWILYVLGVTLSIIVLMTTFLYFWQATPGQKFMQLKIVSYPAVNNDRHLTIDRCLLRSALWCFSWFLLLLPFLEVLSHPLRRALHERASDTLVVSLKSKPSPGPSIHESQLIRNVLRLTFGFISIFFISLGFHTYQDLSTEVEVAQTEKSPDNPECAVSAAEAEEFLDPGDLLLSLTYTKQIPEECLEEQLDGWFLKTKGAKSAMAYLGQGILLADVAKKKEYFKKACDEAQTVSSKLFASENANEICEITEFLAAERTQRKIKLAKNKPLLLSRVLLLENFLEKHEYVSALNVIKELQNYESLKGFVDKKYVLTIWNLNKQSQNNLKLVGSSESESEKRPGPKEPTIRSLRKPANLNNANLQEIFKEFEKGYLNQ